MINELAHPEKIMRENCAETLSNFAKSFNLKEMQLADVKK